MRPTQPFRDEHRALIEQIEQLAEAARRMPRLGPDDRRALRGRVLGFLRGTLLPHAAAEEEVLYPEWARLVGYTDAAAPMIHDHKAIVTRVEHLEAADVDDVDALQQLLYELHALVGVHFSKEEDIQLPAFDAAPEVAASVLGAMARTGEHAH